MEKTPIIYNVINEKKATGIGNVIMTKDFRHGVLAVTITGQDNVADEIVLKVQGSINETAPTFTSASTATNQWSYLQIRDLNDASQYDGDVGVTWTNTNETRLFEVNTNGIQYLTCNITTYTDANTSASVSVNITLYTE